MIRVFNKQEVVEYLKCNPNARPIRIIDALEKRGFKNVRKAGRGDKVTYIYVSHLTILKSSVII